MSRKDLRERPHDLPAVWLAAKVQVLALVAGELAERGEDVGDATVAGLAK